MQHCHIDIETYSEAPLKKVGLYNYAEDPSTEIMVVCYRFGHDGPVNVWIPYREYPDEALPREDKMTPGGNIYVTETCPDDLFDWIFEGKQLRAWNANFERILLNSHAGKKIGIPETPITQWMCTAAKAAAHSLPRALGNAAAACGTHPKDDTGHNVMLQLCKPRKPSKTDPDTRWTVEKHPDKHRENNHYCIDDVLAESDLDRYIPELSPGEVAAYHLDQKINDRGVAVDRDGVANVQALVAEYKKALAKRCKEWTGVSPSQTAKLADWVRGQGYDIENLQVATIKVAVADDACPDHVKRVLRLFSVYNMKAVSKYTAMERAVCSDGRLHGMFLYHGASTGRWSSLIVQLQNLFRPKIKDADQAIEAFSLRDLSWIRDMWSGVNPMVVFASCVRGMLTAGERKMLLCLDFAQIEARVIAWLAGQDDALDVFLSGRDVYKHAAAGIFGVAYDDVTDDQRFIGKIAILALGYQGGKKAFAKMAKNYGVDIEEEFAEGIKVDWRKANPKIVSLWYDLERAAAAAVETPGKIFSVAGKKIMFKVEGDWLYMRLPSKRRLGYYKPLLDIEGKVTFLGVDTYTRKWQRCSTYGGKLAENAVQAIARDLLLRGMFNLEEADFGLIGTVHDEVISEIDEPDDSEAMLAEASELMCRQDDWADGLPIEAEGFVAKRYRK